MIPESRLLVKDAGRFANKYYHSIATSSAATKCKRVMIVNKCKLKFEGKNVAFISAYASNTFDVAFFVLLTKCSLDLTGFLLVLGADFNATWDSNMDKTTWIERRE